MITQQLMANREGHYRIPTGTLLYVPFQIPHMGDVVFSAAHSGFLTNQNWSILMWISKLPNGISVTAEPIQAHAQVIPSKAVVRFGAFDYRLGSNTFVNPPSEPVSWSWPGSSQVEYYLNIQNRETKPNSFFLKIDTRPGAAQ
jgi:hypothetical protein